MSEHDLSLAIQFFYDATAANAAAEAEAVPEEPAAVEIAEEYPPIPRDEAIPQNLLQSFQLSPEYLSHISTAMSAAAYDTHHIQPPTRAIPQPVARQRRPEPMAPPAPIRRVPRLHIEPATPVSATRRRGGRVDLFEGRFSLIHQFNQIRRHIDPQEIIIGVGNKVQFYEYPIPVAGPISDHEGRRSVTHYFASRGSSTSPIPFIIRAFSVPTHHIFADTTVEHEQQILQVLDDKSTVSSIHYRHLLLRSMDTGEIRDQEIITMSELHESTLSTWIEENKARVDRLTPEEQEDLFSTNRQILLDLVHAVSFLHDERGGVIVHRAITSDSVLLDFPNARDDDPRITATLSNFKDTISIPVDMDPSVVAQHLTQDVFAIGALAQELFSGAIPRHHDGTCSRRYLLIHDFITRCMEEDGSPASISDLLAHPLLWSSKTRLDTLMSISNKLDTDRGMIDGFNSRCRYTRHWLQVKGWEQRIMEGDHANPILKRTIIDVLQKCIQFNKRRKFPASRNEPFNLMRFIRNAHQHYHVDFSSMCPELLLDVHLMKRKK
eukprot:gnl/Dysnectes_brevis/1953_a2244_1999.p1 GENE.gnl/Dysnectes_brevis/1953_a2244_1999~~gnl/Dysnectes_brevis/1953_a2244_1999.p1  ORF type:complete len:586 (-),score=103.00 gnl/Dysnectes_brevis/1953_a2244_1999:123-1772(-)